MTQLVQVKIKGTVSTARYGTLVTGDILNTDAAFAKHIVEECNGGEYVETPVKTKQTVIRKPKKAAAAEAVTAPAAAIVPIDAVVTDPADPIVPADEAVAAPDEVTA